jgi:hypothetical protein
MAKFLFAKSIYHIHVLEDELGKCIQNLGKRPVLLGKFSIVLED